MRAHCLMMLSNFAEAEDAAQDVFIKAYQSLGQFRGKAAFSTWLYRITANQCNDILRKKQRAKTESWEALLEKEGDTIEAALGASESKFPEETAEMLAKVLAYLPEKSREVIVLREIQGMNYQELSEALSCTLDAVKSRLKRARQELEIRMRHFLEPKPSKP